jgi:hypothetical protein
MPVIPVIKKSEIKSILVPGQPCKEVSKTPYQQKEALCGGSLAIPTKVRTRKYEDHSAGQQEARPNLKSH